MKENKLKHWSAQSWLSRKFIKEMKQNNVKKSLFLQKKKEEK